MSPIIKRLLRYLIAIIVGAGLIFYVSFRIDESRMEESLRKEKIESGNCYLDEIDLKSLAITYGSHSFKPVFDIDSLNRLFSDYQLGLDPNDTLSGSGALKSFRIENNIFSYFQDGHRVFIKTVELDFSSPFSLQIGGKTAFTPEFQLKDFEDTYPKSYACRWNQSTSWRSEVYAMRINSNRIGSNLEGLILYFSNAENLVGMEFIYSFEEQ